MQKSISYAAYQKSATTKRENELENTITILQKQLDMANNNEPQNQSIIERINLLKRDLEKIIEHRTKGAILRSKSQWYNEGERNTKYFLNLEKRHYKQGTISQLKINETDFVTSDKAILSECESFYKHLYTSKVNNDFASDFFQQANKTVLSHEEQNFCEGFLFEKECAQAVKSMDSNKTPGTDGLPAEFYKIFWKDISTLVVSALNYAFESGCLSITQRRGVIKLIPKKDAELYYIKNWRLITLLNTDYKIAAKALANRIKSVLPSIINNDQTGFMKNRFIGENIRLIDCIIQYAAKENIPGLLLFIDFEKAFDSLEWSFIANSLRFFGFGPSIINWVKVLYCETESCVLNNGWSTNFFQTLRGVRQGCPLSPYLFILSAEVLAKAVRNNVNIKGISVDNNEIKISQYADDITLILDGSREALALALNLLEDFSKVSDLRLNNKKTEALWIGSSIGNEQLILPGRDFKWPKSRVKTSGLWLSVNPETSACLNYNEKIEKIRKTLSCWKYRRLTLLGRITVLKSLAASQLVYLLSPLPCNHHAINEINTLFYQFLWNGKGDKIKRKIMINDYCEGGLKMIDLVSFNKSLKTTWIKKYLDSTNNGKWKVFIDLALKNYGCKNVFTGNLNTKDTKKSIKVSDVFLGEILEIWAEVNFEQQLASLEHFQEQNLWHNSLIRIENKPIFFKDWCSKGITKVKHLQKPEYNSYLSLKEFQLKYDLNAAPLRFYGVISAVKELGNSGLKRVNNNKQEYEPLSTKFLKSKKVSALVYKS